jgi:hypothetical protein
MIQNTLFEYSYDGYDTLEDIMNNFACKKLFFMKGKEQVERKILLSVISSFSFKHV